MNRQTFLFFAIISFLMIGCSQEKEQIIVNHPNGKPAYVEYYMPEDTVNPSRTLRYYITGEKQEEIHYKNGIKDGINTFWYQNGEKMYECNYQNGQLNGTFTQWFDNGKVDYIAKYENGRPSGTWKYYGKDGSLISEQKMQ